MAFLRPIRGCDASIWRESGAYVTQMLRAKFAYDVRHVAAYIMQMFRAPAARNKRCYFWTPLYVPAH
jgi:hypothetical protein